MDELGEAHLRMQQFEKDIEHLKTHIQSLKESHNSELEEQAKMFRRLLQEQKDKMRQKLQNATKKLKLLNRQKKRRDAKIDNLLKQAKDKKILDNESYNILHKDFKSTFAHLVHNEQRNQNKKSSKGRRYDDEVKKFAVTLYYHSPKAYHFCRYVCVSLFTLVLSSLVKGLPVFSILHATINVMVFYIWFLYLYVIFLCLIFNIMDNIALITKNIYEMCC